MTITIGEKIKEQNISLNLFAPEKRIYDTDKADLVLLGEGSTSRAWYIIDGPYKGRIVKGLIDWENPSKDQIEGFLKQPDIIKKIYQAYSVDENNYIMIVRPELFNSSIGPVFLSEHSSNLENDPTLLNYVCHGAEINNNRERLIKALLIAQKILEDLEKYHKSNIINFDIKPENLLKINITGKDFAVRNLDFGSCVFAKDIVKEIFNIKEENLKSEMELRDAQVEKIQKKYCRSSLVFYPYDIVKQILSECFKYNDENSIVQALLSLDIKAVLKIIKTFYFGVPNYSSLKYLDMLRNDWIPNGAPSSLENYEVFYRTAHLLLPIKETYNSGCKDITFCVKQINFLLDLLSGDDSKPEKLYIDNISQFNYLLKNKDMDEELLRNIKIAQISSVELIKRLINAS